MTSKLYQVRQIYLSTGWVSSSVYLVISNCCQRKLCDIYVFNQGTSACYIHKETHVQVLFFIKELYSSSCARLANSCWLHNVTLWVNNGKLHGTTVFLGLATFESIRRTYNFFDFFLLNEMTWRWAWLIAWRRTQNFHVTFSIDRGWENKKLWSLNTN